MTGDPRQAEYAYDRKVRAAHHALSQGGRAEARRLARQAANQDPHREEAWLILAAVSEPKAGLAYAARALDANPRSKAARKAIRYLVRRLPPKDRRTALREAKLPERLTIQLAPLDALARRRFLSGRMALSAVLVCVMVGVWFRSSPADAQQPQVASAAIAKASFTPTPTLTPTPTNTPTPTLTPTPTPTPTDTPTPTPRPAYSFTYSVVPDELAEEGRWIDVDLSAQQVTAYNGASPVRSFIVSTGTAAHPSLTGQYRIYVKYTATPMSGPGYYLPGVPFTMYYYKGYALHGTYWHNNFGTPMSHGCINLRTPDAEWLFNFASVGTLVNVHP